jgi:hypothetical protein
MSFECHVLREERPDGTLGGVGVLWTETRAWLWSLLAVAGGLILPILMLWSVIELQHQLAGQRTGFAHRASDLPHWLILPAFIGLEYVCLAELWDRPMRWRSLFFLADGSNRAPDGFARHRGLVAMPYHQREINSFEVLASREPLRHPVHIVAAYLRNGDVMHVAARLTAVEAHKVAVELNSALAEMRAHRARRALASTLPDAVID